MDPTSAEISTALKIMAGFWMFIGFLWIILPFVIFSMHRQLTKTLNSLESIVGVLELTRREISAMHKIEGLSREQLVRIEKILSEAHHVKFED